MDNEDIVHIYALIDPRDDAVRYVGQTGNLERRFAAHISEATVPRYGYWYDTPTPKSEWILELVSLGLQPLMKSICVVKWIHAPVEENKWIEHYEPTGVLLNATRKFGSVVRIAWHPEPATVVAFCGRTRRMFYWPEDLAARIERVEEIKAWITEHGGLRPCHKIRKHFQLHIPPSQWYWKVPAEKTQTSLYSGHMF